ncbi:hypothetical protein ACE193_10780 [Bernardetia sp. OM2101]|uniref:hypothetical protein n=1 Tax=Bernardetia sp. OM2101 TaxID=3344876 RepID=UPI0035CFCB04
MKNTHPNRLLLFLFSVFALLFAIITFLYKGKIIYLYLDEDIITVFSYKLILLFSFIYVGYSSVYYVIVRRKLFLNQFISLAHFFATILVSAFICYGIYEISFYKETPEMFRGGSLNFFFPHFIGFTIIQVLFLIWVVLSSKPIQNKNIQN